MKKWHKWHLNGAPGALSFCFFHKTDPFFELAAMLVGGLAFTAARMTSHVQLRVSQGFAGFAVRKVS